MVFVLLCLPRTCHSRNPSLCVPFRLLCAARPLLRGHCRAPFSTFGGKSSSLGGLKSRQHFALASPSGPYFLLLLFQESESQALFPRGLLGPLCLHLPSGLFPFIFTQGLRTPFLGRFSALMDGITTSWSTDGAAKVGEGKVSPGIKVVPSGGD